MKNWRIVGGAAMVSKEWEKMRAALEEMKRRKWGGRGGEKKEGTSENSQMTMRWRCARAVGHKENE